MANAKRKDAEPSGVGRRRVVHAKPAESAIVPALIPPLPGTRLPIVYWPRPRCPECRRRDFKKNWRGDQGDGTKLLHCHCAACGFRWKLVLE